MNSKEPLISILTAAYNGSDYIEELILSILGQSYMNYEHIIINDGSTDNGATENILGKYPHLKWRSRENKGQYATQNELLKEATGDIITIINQDDRYVDEDVLETVVSEWRKEDNLDFTYGNVRYIDDSGRVLPYRYAFERKRSRWMMTNVSCIYHIALFVRKAVIDENNINFDPDLKMGGDWDWNIQMIRASRNFAFIRKPLSYFRIHKNQKTLAVGEKGFGPEVNKICRKHGINPFVNAVLRKYVNIKTRLRSGLQILLEQGPVEFIRRAIHYFSKRK